MSTFKTKLNSCLSATDELQYVKSGDSTPSPYKDNAPRQKQPNYKLSLVKAVASGKSLYLHQEQLTGKGVNNKKQIYKDVEHRQEVAPGHCTFSKIDRWSKQRCLKKDNIIYDLLN
jgi:hypothetical protein